jgi:F-type H+-transporting ATPase subunit b
MEHAGHAIPWNSIWIQFFNFAFLLIVLGYLMRKTVKAHFANRAAEFRQLVERAEAAKAEAEKGRRTMQDRLARLESTAAESGEKARKDAEALKDRMLVEARGLANKIDQEARRSISVEIEKAKAQLREELLDQGLKNSGEQLKTNLGGADQKKLQNEFVEKIQVVGG